MARRILWDPPLPRARRQALLLEGRIADWRRFLVSCVNQLAWLLLRISRPLQEWTMQASAMSRSIMTLGLARRLRTVYTEIRRLQRGTVPDQLERATETLAADLQAVESDARAFGVPRSPNLQA